MQIALKLRAPTQRERERERGERFSLQRNSIRRWTFDPTKSKCGDFCWLELQQLVVACCCCLLLFVGSTGNCQLAPSQCIEPAEKESELAGGGARQLSKLRNCRLSRAETALGRLKTSLHAPCESSDWMQLCECVRIHLNISFCSWLERYIHVVLSMPRFPLNFGPSRVSK